MEKPILSCEDKENYPLADLARVVRDRAGPQKYARSKERARATGQHVVISRPGRWSRWTHRTGRAGPRDGVRRARPRPPDHRPGRLQPLDGGVPADAGTSTDVAMPLRDVMMPLPLREGWGEDMEWPYPGVPASILAELGGHRVAALPFFAPETVTTDHGSVSKCAHQQLHDFLDLVEPWALPLAGAAADSLGSALAAHFHVSWPSRHRA
jgi:hypothetical protein